MKDADKFISQVESLAEKWDISTALCIQDTDGLFYEKAFGHADAEKTRPLTTADRFCLPAHTSFFLALCMMHLAEAGKLRFSDTLDRFLPEYKHAKRITIAHLLRWEAGLQDYQSHVRMPKLQQDPAHAALSEEERFRKEYVFQAEEFTFAQVLDMMGEDDLLHDPGKEDDGSDTTVVFMAEIIRRLSGMAPRECLFVNIFGPLGLHDTAPGNTATLTTVANMDDREWIPLPALNPSYAFTTTLHDLNILARSLAEKKLFSEKTMRAALRCKRDYSALGFGKVGEMYYADNYPTVLRDVFRIYFNFDDGLTIVALNAREFVSKNEGGQWKGFPSQMRRAWQDTRVYPKNPQLKPIGSKNVWDAMDVEILPKQLSFVPNAQRCIASTIARRQPAYVLMDHGVPIGIACLTIERKKKEYHVTFLQVDHRYQGRGYGRILLTKALEILKEKGATSLEIGVNRYNIPAQRLYRSVGFQDDNVYEGFIGLKMEL